VTQTTSHLDYDLIVIGSGPAGEKAAVHAAYHGLRVAVVEKQPVLGGAGVNTGTLPSKTLKETALYLSGVRDRGLFKVGRKLERAPDVEDFLFREQFVVRTEANRSQLELVEDKVDIHYGAASFLDPHRIQVQGGESEKSLTGRFILVATGSSPAHAPDIPFDGLSVHDSDTVLKINRIPKSLCIVGAGTIGCEYATIFAALGAQVTLLNGGTELLPFLDREIVAALIKAMETAGITLRTGVRVGKVTVNAECGGASVRAELGAGNVQEAEMFLYTAGRSGNTQGLECEKAGLHPTERGLLEVDETYRTAVAHIFAAGDVIGFPALGSTSMDQGRVAVTHMFNLRDVERIATAVPYGIYTIPEVSMVGLTEKKAREAQLNFAVARAQYADVPRGVIIGDENGFLKILFDRTDQTVLGVHIIGQQATELIHYGMELVEGRRNLKHIIGAVFNFPTLHELYKRAAYEAWEKHG
jgi:NAD(P) transhydrogenase